MSFLATRLGKLVTAFVAAAGVLMAAVSFGRKTERAAQDAEDNEAFIETTKEINDVEVSPDRDAAIKRLRDNGWTR